MNQVIAFRADASLQIGTGHVMRCLTLANALAARGAQCHFLCRAHEGNLIEFVRAKGHDVHALSVARSAGVGSPETNLDDNAAELAHSLWLGATQAEDIDACTPLLAALHPDWLIVDHYALDSCWERALAPHCGQLMVIDDLADRPHACDLLLDQTFGRAAHDYRAWVPPHCQLLCGSRYALLRPEFAALRTYSLQRRAHPQLRQLLITMGGVDKDNATGKVLAALRGCTLPDDCKITVAMGATAPWWAEVERQAQTMPWPTRVQVGVRDMAQLIADSDLAIGAAGATSWERCCLGLPTAMLVLASNQRHAAALLEQAGAARLLQLGGDLPMQLARLIDEATQSEAPLRRLSDGASVITDGEGAQRVADHLMMESVNE